MTLRRDWIDRIFTRLIGIYGAQFKSKFSVVVDGVDVGIETAKQVWAEELAGFATCPDAIAYGLKYLPPDHAPNAIEFRDICRRAPKKDDTPMLPHKPTAQDVEHARELSEQVAKSMRSKISDGIDRHWATHPRTKMQLAFIFDAARKDSRFESCIEEMVEKEICTRDGKLLKAYLGGDGWTDI